LFLAGSLAPFVPAGLALSSALCGDPPDVARSASFTALSCQPAKAAFF
jgi:hypothetical protein